MSASPSTSVITAPAVPALKIGARTSPYMPIVIVTGYPDSDMLDNILKHGPVTVLKKPLKVEQVAQTLKFLGHKIAEAQVA